MNNKEINDQIELRIHQKTQSIEQLLRTHMLESEKFHREMNETLKLFHDHIEPIYEWFQNITFLKSSVMWGLTIIGMVIGAIIGLKELAK